MSSIIVVSTGRKVKSLVVFDGDARVAAEQLDTEIAKLLEIDQEARPLGDVQSLESPNSHVFMQQWTYLERVKY